MNNHLNIPLQPTCQQVNHQMIMIADITESVRIRIENHGLEDAMRLFDSMDLLLSRHPSWHLVKCEVETMFAERRKEERMMASLSRVVQENKNCQVFMGTVNNSEIMGNEGKRHE